MLCGGLSIWSHLGRQLLTLTKRGASWRDTATGTSARLLHHFVLNLLCHGLERQIDILRRLCTSFEEWHAELAGELLSLFEGDLASIRHVTLVAHENLANTRLRVLFNFVDPRSHIVECFSVCHVVDDDDALSAYQSQGESRVMVRSSFQHKYGVVEGYLVLVAVGLYSTR